MASSPPEAAVTQTHVFRVSHDMHRLELIAPPAWQQIIQHALPLQPANAAVRLLIVQGTAPNTSAPNKKDSADLTTDAYCKSIDALQLQTDSFGFLLTWDASSTQSLPALHPAQQSTQQSTQQSNQTPSTVIDSRQRFLRRYLSHRHSWQPSTPLLAEALIRCGYAQAQKD